jgi:ATP-binding cassette subfamily C protein
LLAAAQLVSEALQIPIQAGHIQPPPSTMSHAFQLEEIAKAANVRTRQVALRGDWWNYDVQPLLAFIEPIKPEEANEQNPPFIPPESGGTEGGSPPTTALRQLALTLTAPRPVAILPALNQRGYEIVDPVAQTRTLLTSNAAEVLAYFAYSFYRPFPNRALTLMDLARLGAFGLQRDLGTILATGGLIGLFALATPLAIGVLFESVIPNAEIHQLLQLTIALIIITLATALLQLARSFAFLRIQSKADAAIQAAVWDRLLRLPTTFFRQYSAGDLAVRANGINTIKDYLTGSTMNALFGGVMAIFYVGLLCYYSLSLAFVGMGLVMVAVVITLIVGIIKLNYQRQLIEVEGRISGMVFQFIGGIAKFRASGTENWVFATWARDFMQQRQLAFKAETVANGLVVFNSSYSILASLVIFLAFIYFNPRLTADLSTGHFLAFYSAFGLLLGAALDLTNTVIGLLNIIPVYERLQPILQTLPEVAEGQFHPGELTGAIELSNVVFRYQADGPRILNSISLQIKAGQFVAFVGPSGSGKSTILRLLLGFEQCESGAVYYDGQDLKTLNIQAVRRQIGTVLQSGGLMPSTIFSNIVGSSPLTLDDAWKAARLAGLAEDIEKMPMGMHTSISEGATTFSGGQRQRLLIARAIVNNPRILLFDEATSALDNRTQAVVNQSLETFHATRIVIAHRLSTVVNADVIFVIDKGEVVQKGTYQELVNQPGPFAELAKRQLA